MKKKLPLVSIIIRTKNRPRLLSRAIESVYSQEYENIEIIIVNDGGEDIVSVVNHFINLPTNKQIRKIELITNKTSINRPSAANVGLQSAKGEYIGFLDDDDYFFNNHVSVHISYLLKNNSNVSFTKATESIEEGLEKKLKTKGRYSHFPSSYNKLSYLFFDNYFPINTFIFKADILEKIGYFDETKEVLEDWDFLIRILLNYEPLIINKITAEFTTRIGWFNARQDAALKVVWEDAFREIREKYRVTLLKSEISMPISEVANFLSALAKERYKLIHENEILRDSFAYKVFHDPLYITIKKIIRKLHLTYFTNH